MTWALFLLLLVVSSNYSHSFAFGPYTTLNNHRRSCNGCFCSWPTILNRPKKGVGIGSCCLQKTQKYLQDRFPLRSNRKLDWDGDDLRYLSILKRRFRRFWLSGSTGTSRPFRNGILSFLAIVFLFQAINGVQWIAKNHPSYWPRHAHVMIWDALLGNAAPSPLERDFGHIIKLARFQPHRYITSGFLHRGLIHLLCNLNEIRRQPAWLETGLGGGLYMTTFLTSIVAGCLGHEIWGRYRGNAFILLGASSGVCGLYGLMFVSLGKMGNHRESIQALIGTAIVGLYSILSGDATSNFAHLGGFLAGCIMAILLGPTYSKSYSMRREWSTYVDTEPKDYRAAMGFGIKAKKRGPGALSLFWTVLGIWMVIVPKLRSVPSTILRGLLHPGSLS